MISFKFDDSFLYKEVFRKDKEALLNSRVSVVEALNKSYRSYPSTFGFILDQVKTKDIQQFKILKGWKGSDKDKEYKEIKQTLIPSFTLTTYSDSNEGTGKLKDIRNPYIIIDVDNIETSQENLEKINSVPYVLGTGISISGQGFWSVLKFDDSIVDTFDKYKAMYEELKEYYEDLDILIDESCSNINRLRVISPYDFIWNEGYKRSFQPSLNFYEQNKKKRKETFSYSSNQTLDNDCLGLIKEPYIKGEMYSKRWKWANTLYYWFGDDGYGLYLDILSEDQSTPQELEAIWKTSKNSNKEPNRNYTQILKVAGLIKDDKEDNQDNNLMLDF